MAGTRQEKPTIESITIKHMADDYPDLTWLGEYSNKVPACADRRRGDFVFRHKAGPRECKYFIPGYGTVAEIRVDLRARGYSRGVAEEMARAQIRKGFKRMEDYGNSWAMIGIQAEAMVKYRIRPNDKDWRLEHFKSGGVWGIESDSGNDHLEDIEREELADLREHLKRFSIRMNKKEWARLIANIEKKEV